MEWVADDPEALRRMAGAMADGTWWSEGELQMSKGTNDTNLVLGKLAELRKRVGVLKAKKKDGVRFKVRSADELSDRIRPVADGLGLLIYPIRADGTGHVVEDGTLASVNIVLRIQAVEDGSYVDVAGYGLGADNQDKAGGKAGTYAWKSALVQTLLAGGSEDTDDTDTPIQGGVRKKAGAAPAPAATRADVEAKIAEAKVTRDMAVLKAAVALAGTLPAAEQTAMVETIKAVAAEIRGAA